MSNYKINRLSYIEFDHEPTPDELMHFKYIKREKVNGKWVYTYPDGSKSSKVGDRVKDVLGYDERARLGEAIRKYNHASSNAKRYDEIQSDPTRKKWYTQEKSDQLHKAAADAGKVMSKRYKEYYKTPIGKLDKFDDAIDKGRNFLADMLEGASKKVRARDEYLAKY